jgi:RimJ/RimL family protein N-acetyltransferase
MQKLGMSYEGTRRQHVQKWGVFEDLALYGILKSDWDKQSSM